MVLRRQVRLRSTIALLSLALFAAAANAQQPVPLPIIDMHVHAYPANGQGPPPLAMCTPLDPFPVWDPAEPWGAAFMRVFKEPTCDDPIWSPETDDEVRDQTLEILRRRNIIPMFGGSPGRVAMWREAFGRPALSGLDFNVARMTDVTPDSLRTLHAAGRLDVLAEVTNQYAGVAPNDPLMEPYWALAEELDIPVGYHVAPGPPGATYLGQPVYGLHSPLLLEDVLVRHPKLRLYVMHGGYPMLDDLLALLNTHPQVYIDVGVIAYVFPRAGFYRFLKGVVDGGFSNRIMFGSDQMVWPASIERALASIEEAPFLTESQKRDILYNNAARFLRFSPEQIRGHHETP